MKSRDEIKPVLWYSAVTRTLENLLALVAGFAGTSSANIRYLQSLPHQGLSVVIAIIGSFAVSLSIYSFFEINIPPSFVLIALMIVLFFLSGIYFLYKETVNRKLVITNRNVEYQDNYLDREKTQVAKADITNIDARKSLLGRLFDIGSLRIYTAGSQEPIIKMRKIKTPEKIQKQLLRINEQQSSF